MPLASERIPPAPYREYRLRAPLSQFVECVWFLFAPARAAGAPPERILPDGCVEVVVQLAGRTRASRGGGPFVLQPSAFVVGPFASPLLLEPVGALETLGIRFRPGGASPFLPLPVDLLLGVDLEIDLAFGRTGTELVERLRVPGAISDLSRVRLVEEFLLARLRGRIGGDGRRSPVAGAVSRMLSIPRYSVSRIARECGRSTRQVERYFRAEVGLPPRLLGRLIRFQRVLRAAAERETPWISVALDCGYADQAHLIRDFREFAGQTPAAYVREDAGMGAAFLTPERLDGFFGT
ncbi:MAG: AraC family transcriptional regulator [Acidobacteriota bacterium]